MDVPQRQPMVIVIVLISLPSTLVQLNRTCTKEVWSRVHRFCRLQKSDGGQGRLEDRPGVSIESLRCNLLLVPASDSFSSEGCFLLLDLFPLPSCNGSWF